VKKFHKTASLTFGELVFFQIITNKVIFKNWICHRSSLSSWNTKMHSYNYMLLPMIEHNCLLMINICGKELFPSKESATMMINWIYSTPACMEYFTYLADILDSVKCINVENELNPLSSKPKPSIYIRKRLKIFEKSM